MTTLDLTVRIALALVLGAMIGAERQWRQRNAGLRTNTLVSVGSALFVSLSFMVDGEVSQTRIAAQVVSGIGFLGAGVILREGLNIRGLNTAATLWCSAATGVLCGSGYLLAASIGCFSILGANVGLRPIAKRLNRRQASSEEVIQNYKLRVDCEHSDGRRVRSLLLEALRANELTPHAIRTDKAKRNGHTQITAELTCSGKRDPHMEQILTDMSQLEPVLGISWRARRMKNENGS